VVVLNPQDVGVLKQVGRSLYLLGKHDQALQVYEEVLRCGVEDWEVYHNKGLSLRYLGRFDEAIAAFTAANAIQRMDASFLQLGKVLELQEKHKEAVEVYLKALEFTPENTTILTALGLLYNRMGEAITAFEYLGKALTHDPKNGKVILAAGSIIQDNNDMDIALHKYRAAAALTPNR
jgi:Bardet-Biedl syndrome 4 protein